MSSSSLNAPPEILARYLQSLENALHACKSLGEREAYRIELLANNRANIAVRIRFRNGFLFEANEAIVCKKRSLEHLAYRYQAQKSA